MTGSYDVGDELVTCGPNPEAYKALQEPRRVRVDEVLEDRYRVTSLSGPRGCSPFVLFVAEHMWRRARDDGAQGALAA